jgi:hypothetical protein
MGPRDMDGSTNNVPGTGVGTAVDVGKVVGDGIAVGATEAIWVAVGVRAVPQPARHIAINVTIVKLRSIGVSRTICNFILPISKIKRASLWNAQFSWGFA